ncbi:hypothetical protein RvY_13642 [Ramazzottius varieornatus]|uniref:Uncharacterized protein n=1 Tax=Ramazzottius varieornatus TaxID=947166 RepID=A0A1D1VNK7_RAMVA|nr:hypothetical protein RvY_13642 [Ramazzottius varieornatus]
MAGSFLACLFLAVSISSAISAPSFTFQTMAPIQFGNMNFNTMQQMQNRQRQGQSQGNSAATGDASADFGSLQSLQTSNTLTGVNGTNSQAGSQGACIGGNCGLSGAAQLSAQGQSQKQNQFGTMASLNNLNLLGGNFGTQNFASQRQRQSQSAISGAAVGQGNAALGNITSVQNIQGDTSDRGANVGSQSIGQGVGTGLGLSGAVQAKGQNQAAVQMQNQGSQGLNGSSVENVNRPNCVMVRRDKVAQQDVSQALQGQSQSQGEGASVGSGSAAEGALSSAQNSNISTNENGTVVASNSVGQAQGKGLRLSGATSSQGQQADQKQTNGASQGVQGDQLVCV